jgi:hypothetical protein
MTTLKQRISLAAFLVGLFGMTASALADAVTFPEQLEIPACAILDEKALPEFKLSQEQESEWRRLRQEHQILRGDSCRALSRPDVQRMSSVMQSGDDEDAHARALQLYQKHLLGFLVSLSGEQQNILAETIRTQQKAAEELREKIILHSLML